MGGHSGEYPHKVANEYRRAISAIIVTHDYDYVPDDMIFESKESTQT